MCSAGCLLRLRVRGRIRVRVRVRVKVRVRVGVMIGLGSGSPSPFQLGAVSVNSVSSSNPVVGVTTILPPLGGVLIATLTVDSPGR